MRKKCLASLLALAMLLSLLPTAVFAAEPKKNEVTVSETVDTSDANLADNDELFAGYVQQLMYPSYGGIALFANWGSSIGVLNDAEQGIYTQLKGKIEDVAANGGSTEFQLTAPSITWETTASGDALQAEASQQFSSALNTSKILDCLLVDCPYELYWYDKTETGGVEWRYGIQSSSGVATITNLTVTLYVAQGYQAGNNTTVSASQVTAAKAAAAKAQAIVDQYANLSDYEKMLAYKNWICNNVEYNHTAADDNTTPYGDPWQIIYVFDGDTSTNVVCEGYAKAFQYLCDLSEFDNAVCYTVTGQMAGGTGAGGHMWNIVTLEGKNYLVDVTNCDGNSVGNPDKLFLKAPTSGNAANGYVFSLSNDITYTYDTDIKSLYGEDILTLSDTSYTPPKAVTGLTITATCGEEPLHNDSIIDVPLKDQTKTVTLTATATYSDGTTAEAVDAVWEIEGNPWGVTINENQLIINPTASNPGQIAVVQVSASYGGQSAYIKFQLKKDLAKVTSFDISGPSSIAIPASGSNTAEYYIENICDQYGGMMSIPENVEWSITGVTNVSVNSSTGVVTVPANATPGTATLTARCGEASSTFTINLISKQDAKLTITGGPAEVVVGSEGFELNANIAAVDPTADFNWSSSNEAVLFIQSYAGLYRNQPYIVVRGPGTATITATYEDGTYYGQGSVEITVLGVPTKDDFTVTWPESLVYDGNPKAATVTVNSGITGMGSYKVLYNGSETAPVNVGEYTVTIQVNEGELYTAAELNLGTLTIAKVTPTITVPSSSLTMVKDTTRALGAAISNGGALTYESSNPGVASVSNDGTVTAKAVGEAIITVTYAGNNNYNSASATVNVTVTDKNPVTVTFNNAASQTYKPEGYALGGQFTAATVEGGKAITKYIYDNTEYASLDALNSVIVTDVGTYTVTAVYDSETEYGEATAAFTITKANQAALTITSANTVTYGNTLSLTTEGGSGTGAVTFAVTDGTDKATVSGSTLTPTQAGTVTVTATKAGDNNYNAVTSAPVPITIAKANYTGTTAATGSAKYGNTGTVDLSDLIVLGGTATVGTVTDSSNILNGDPAISNGVLSFTFVNDSGKVDKTATIPVSVTSANYEDYTITVTVTVLNKQKDTATMTVSLDGWAYGAAANTPIVSSVSGGTAVYSYSGTGSTTYGPSAAAPTAAGTYRVTATYETSDTIYTATADFTIAKADPVIGTVSYLSTAPIYESTDLNGINLSRSNDSVDGTLKLQDGQTLTVGTRNYLWIFTPNDTANYNTITGNVALTVSEDALTGISVSGTPAKAVYTYGEAFDLSGLTVTANYASGATKDVTDQVTYGALAVGQTSVVLSYQGKTCTVTGITVNKAEYIGTKDAAGSARYGTTGTVDLSSLIASGGTAALGTVTDNEGILNGDPTLSGNVLTYAFKDNGNNVDKTAKISVSVTSANYNTYTVTVTVTVSDKLTPVLTVSDITVTYTGQPVPASAIQGTATYDGKTVPGTWSWTGGNAYTNAGSYQQSVTFTPSDTDTYTTNTATVKVTINKATPAGTPGYTAISTSGKTLADAKLTTGSFTVKGSVAWADDADTEVKVNTSYKWIFTPDDTDNYNTVTGAIELWHRSSSSGGSSSSGNKTETEKNPDGSTTTTVTKPNGTVTETTKNPDGSQEVVETKKDGTVTTTTTDKTGNKTEVVENTDGSSQTTVDNKDGSSSVTKVDEDGKVEAQVELPERVVVNAASKGEAVTLPMPSVSASSHKDEAPTVTVDLPRNSSAKVEIPVRRVTSGTVAVLVKADGTEQVIKTSLITDNGVTVTLSDGDTVKIVDNAKSFADVSSRYWGSDYIDFVTSREIFSGTGSNTFSPDMAMNRAMIVTVLAAYDGADTSSTGGAWYEAGQRWAMENGISDGTNMEQSLTREQLAVMLWSYAGRPTDGGSLAGYSDTGSVSSWATQAMAWAVKNGLISGMDGTLAPQGTATRAQVATILMRFVEKTA